MPVGSGQAAAFGGLMRATAGPRRRFVVAVALPLGLFACLAAAMLGYYAYGAASSVLPPSAYAQLEIGAPADVAGPLLPSREMSDAPSEHRPEPPGATSESVTEGGILVFVVLFVVQWWRARTGENRSMAHALLAPFVVAVVNVVSEIVNVWLHEERPCRDIPGVRSIAPCPAPRDWSFPSNHAVIAAASAMKLLFTWRSAGLLTLPLAVLVALSRVYVGVHYLHDVAAGLLLGALVAPLLPAVLAAPGSWAVDRLRGQRGMAPALGR
ncbi:phosphatase PAP2 family protein [Streptomyces sp. NPDC060035]|uniref:phosphatase PAP2 family protein n=1 Tax=Streptomyces sp. NPDC060035 TaxID=3347044 RepID=UPI0036985ABF